MKYFFSSTLTVLCVLSTPLQALAKVQGEASATELSTREPQFLNADVPDIVDETDLLDDLVNLSRDVNSREDNAAGIFWPPRRRPIRRIRPVYIRPRPRPRPRPRRRPHPRRPNRNINVNGANGGTNIGGNGANGGNIRVTRNIQTEEQSSVAKRDGNHKRQRYGGGGGSRGGGRRHGGSGSRGGGRRYGGGGGGGRRYGGGGGRRYGGGGGRRYGGGGGGAGPATKANVSIKGADGGTNGNGENGEKSGDIQKEVEA